MRPNTEQGFTLVELLVGVTIISIIAGIAAPGLLRARMTGNETSAIASLKVTSQSQVAYSASCGNNGYASTYVVLGTPPAGSTEAFISQDLGAVVAPIKSGFNFTLGPGAGSAAGPNDCNGSATITAFYGTAVPQTLGTTGTRSFAFNAAGAIWQNGTAVAPTEPFGPPSTPVQ